jgi:hypothetical protein
MPAKLLKGTEIREAILAEIKQELEAITTAHGVVPGLVTILVGGNPASLSCVSLKIKTAHRLGFKEPIWEQLKPAGRSQLLQLDGGDFEFGSLHEPVAVRVGDEVDEGFVGLKGGVELAGLDGIANLDG